MHTCSLAKCRDLKTIELGFDLIFFNHFILSYPHLSQEKVVKKYAESKMVYLQYPCTIFPGWYLIVTSMSPREPRVTPRLRQIIPSSHPRMRKQVYTYKFPGKPYPKIAQSTIAYLVRVACELRLSHSRRMNLSIDVRAWEGIGGWDWVVDVELDSGFLAGVDAGDGNLWWRATGTVLDVELSAGDIELSTGVVGSGVEGDVLETEEVLLKLNVVRRCCLVIRMN